MTIDLTRILRRLYAGPQGPAPYIYSPMPIKGATGSPGIPLAVY